MNQHLLSWLNLSFRAKALQSGDGRERDGRGFLEGHIGWFQRQGLLTRTHILCESAPTTLGQVPEYLITWLKLRDVPANCFNPPRHGSPEDGVFWFEKPKAHEAHQERVSFQEM